MGLEGLVSKRSDRPYRGGRTKDWIKIKNQQHELSINRTCGATASRVGIATGMIIVSSPPVDGGGAQKLELVGDPPGTAARLQVLASSGTVLIDQSTRQLIGDLFDCRDIGVIDASGTARAWEVLGPGTAESRFAAIGPAKQIAQVGAAIGREFSYELLFAVVSGTDADLQSALERLTDTGLVFRRGSPPRSTYLFKLARSSRTRRTARCLGDDGRSCTRKRAPLCR